MVKLFVIFAIISLFCCFVSGHFFGIDDEEEEAFEREMQINFEHEMFKRNAYPNSYGNVYDKPWAQKPKPHQEPHSSVKPNHQQPNQQKPSQQQPNHQQQNHQQPNHQQHNNQQHKQQQPHPQQPHPQQPHPQHPHPQQPNHQQPNPKQNNQQPSKPQQKQYSAPNSYGSQWQQKSTY